MPVTLYIPSSDKIVHETKVDFRQRDTQSVVHIVQYDKSLPIVAVKLYSNGTPYILPELSDINIRWGKRDRTFVYNPILGCNSDRTIVYFEITAQMTTLEGEHNPILELINGSSIAGSGSMPFYIDRNPIQEGDIESSIELGVLEDIREDILELQEGMPSQIHNLIDPTHHIVSDLISGYFLKATGPTTYAFAPHGLTASDVGARSVAWVPSASDITGLGASYRWLTDSYISTWNAKSDAHTHPYLSNTHAASGVTTIKISNWDAAYTWGNHVGLYRLVSWVPSASDITGLGASYRWLTDAYISNWNAKSDAHTHPYRADTWVPSASDITGLGASYRWLTDAYISTWNAKSDAHTHPYLPLAGGTLTNRLIIDYSATGGDGTWDKSGILIKNLNTSEAETAIAMQLYSMSSGSNYWIQGLNQSNVYKWIYGQGFADAGIKMQLDTSGNFSASGTVQGTQLKSTIAIGTPPITVISTTKVTNLNSDKLDDQEGSYYTTAGNLSGTISSAVLGNSTVYIGTTAIALNRGSATLALTGVTNINWDTAYSWGNHSGLYRLANWVPSASDITGLGASYRWLTDTYISTWNAKSDAHTHPYLSDTHDAAAVTGTKISNWDTAYSWGNHALAGYLTSQISHADVVVDGDFISNGILKRTSAGVYGIITDNSVNWDTAYSWGNHSGLYRLVSWVPSWSDVTSKIGSAYGTTAGTFAEGNHTHLYAGSSSAGGSATTAVKLATARTINVSTGVSGTATSFDGSANISIPINSVSEAYLAWGGKDFSGSYGPIDAAMVPELGANRTAFLPASKITIEYSIDSGSNWFDYSPTDERKVNLFNGVGGFAFIIGKNTNDAIADKSPFMLRVSVNQTGSGLYTVLNKFVMYLSTSTSTGCYCIIDGSLNSTPSTFVTLKASTGISGWSGYNVINTSGITFGANSDQYGIIRFTFGCTGGSVLANYYGLGIYKILSYGGVGWSVPSTMARNGDIYTYDYLQNVLFPGTIQGTQLKSTIAIGTAPLTVTSTTVVSNLNSDYLDGQHGSYYTNPANIVWTSSYRSVNDTEKSTWNAKSDAHTHPYRADTWVPSWSDVTSKIGSAYGTTAGTFAEGNHNHNSVYEPIRTNPIYGTTYGTLYSPVGADILTYHASYGWQTQSLAEAGISATSHTHTLISNAVPLEINNTTGTGDILILKTGGALGFAVDRYGNIYTNDTPLSITAEGASLYLSTSGDTYLDSGIADLYLEGNKVISTPDFKLGSSLIDGANSTGTVGQILKIVDIGAGVLKPRWGTDNNTTYSFATGTTGGAFSVTPSGGSASAVTIYNDATHRWLTDTYISTWNAKSDAHTHPYRSDTWVPSASDITGLDATHRWLTDTSISAWNAKSDAHTHPYLSNTHAASGVTTTKITNWDAAYTHSIAAHAPSNAVPLTSIFDDTSTYRGLFDKAGITTEWIRTTVKGIIPFTDSTNTSQVGAATWPFNKIYGREVYGTTIYRDGIEINSLYSAIHTHPYRADTWVPSASDITGLDATHRWLTDTSISAWNAKSDAHTHPYRADTWVPSWSDVTSKIGSAYGTTAGTFAEGNHTHTYTEVGAAAASHNHSASNITSGTMPISRGGTNASSYANPGGVIYYNSQSTMLSVSDAPAQGDFLMANYYNGSHFGPQWETAATAATAIADEMYSTTTISSLAANTLTTSAYTVTGYHFCTIQLSKTAANTTTTVFTARIDLTDTNQRSTTTGESRYIRMVWNDGSSTYADNLEVYAASSTTIKFRHAAGVTFRYRITWEK